MSPITFWTAIGAAGAVGAAFGTIIGLSVAWLQLRRLTKSTDSEAVLKLYELFDDNIRRMNRKEIYDRLQHIEPGKMNADQWTVIEQTATEMDVVGTMLKHKQVKSEFIFERYTEVIIPLWEAIHDHVEKKREMKGGFGWSNFEWMVEKTKQWSLKNRKTTTYKRFISA